MIVDVRAHLDLFDVLRLLRFACRVRLFLRLVFEFADVEELGDGRIGVGRDLHEIEADFGRLLDRLFGIHDAEIFALLIDDAHLLRLNELVMARAVLRRIGGTAGKRGTYSGIS